MPIIKSAKKRVRTAEKAAILNSKTKRSVKTALKAFHAAVTGGKVSADVHADAQSAIDVAAKKGLIHKNKAARQKAQLAKLAKDAGAEAPSKKKAAAKKPAASKAKASPAKTAKPAATKKSATKATTKKPAAKK